MKKTSLARSLKAGVLARATAFYISTRECFNIGNLKSSGKAQGAGPGGIGCRQ